MHIPVVCMIGLTDRKVHLNFFNLLRRLSNEIITSTADYFCFSRVKHGY